MKLLILVACLLNVAITVPVRERHPSRVTKKPETEHHGVRRRVERSASGSSEMRMTRFIIPRQQQADIPPVPNIPPIPIPIPVPIPLDPTAINAAGMPIAQYLRFASGSNSRCWLSPSKPYIASDQVPAPAQFYPGFPGMAGFPPILGVSSQMAWMRNPNCPTEYPGLGKPNRLEDLPGPHQL